MLDSSINVGNLLQIATMILGGLYFLWRLETKVLILTNEIKNVIKERDVQHQNNQSRFVEIEQQLQKLIDLTITLATFKARMDNADERMQTLSDRIEEYVRAKLSPIPRKRSRD